MQLETLHNILHQGTIDIVRIRIFLAKNLSWLTVQQRLPAEIRLL